MCGVALVFGVMFVDVLEPFSVSGRLGALSYVSGRLGVGMVSDCGKHHLKDAT